MEKVSFVGRQNCGRISNGVVELIVGLDFGPRILRYAFTGEENALAELPDVTMQTSLGEWKPWGGHRLWAAPESMPRTYSIDNDPIEAELLAATTVRLRQTAANTTAGIEKEITVALDAEGTGVTVRHKLTNRNLWGIDMAPWALTIMHGGGVAIVPQEPYGSHDEFLLPARPLVLWHFTRLRDARLTLGNKYICLQTDVNVSDPQKFGVTNKQGWAAYLRERTLFVKRFAFQEGAVYPDYGSNNEVYTAGSFIEIESLAPMRHLEPGESADHEERWNLFHSEPLDSITDDAVERVMKAARGG